MKKITIIFFLILSICITIFLIPRNHTAEDFKNMSYGDSFIVTMLRFGKPTMISQGGTMRLYFKYRLLDDSVVVMNFGKNLISLEACVRYKNNEVIEVYVSMDDGLK